MVTGNFVPANITVPHNDILFHSPATKLIVNKQDLGLGSLYVTESNVIWRNRQTSAANPVPRISLLHHTISFYGIQRQPALLYMVINFELGAFIPELPQPSHSEDEEFDPEEHPITELRFIPEHEGRLHDLHSALNIGQTLNPDPADEVYEEEEEADSGDIFEDIEDPFEANIDEFHTDEVGRWHATRY